MRPACFWFVLAVFVATPLHAAHTALPRAGVVNSVHDINVLTGNPGIEADSHGRVCAFCHTPHHNEESAIEYNPLWSHQVTTIVAVPYASATFDGGNLGHEAVDPLIGPSRLCMSCHDGVIAPDQHYGTLFPGIPPAGRFAADDYGDIAVGLGGWFGNDHPIGFDVALVAADTGIFADTFAGRRFLVGGVASGGEIAAGLYDASGTGAGPFYFTCATCHDVHNRENVENCVANQYDANHPDNQQRNYLVHAPQSGSQLCLSCHDK